VISYVPLGKVNSTLAIRRRFPFVKMLRPFHVMTRTKQHSVQRYRSINFNKGGKIRGARPTARVWMFVSVIACTGIATPGNSSARISSRSDAALGAQLSLGFGALVQSVPDGAFRIARVSFMPRHQNCGSFGGSTGPGAICLAYGWPYGHLAQQDGFRVEEISSPSGTSIPIVITFPNDLQQTESRVSVFLMFKGLPPEITLSSGFRVSDDAWVVSVNDAPNLAMSSPPGYQGSYQLAVTLHKGREANPETRVISVRLGAATAHEPVAMPPPAQPTATASPDAESVSAVGSIPAKTDRLGEGEETALLQNAAEMLKNGDIEAARLAYSELAAHGSGEAAYLMAQTYDPQVLEKYFVVGMQPDAALAKQWYGRAAGLGYGEAKERLTTLNAQ
jgi:hypothetical protein